MPDPALWRPKSSEIPVTPGVYRFLDDQGQVLYIGKAINLRARLSSYFQDPAHLHPRTAAMVNSAARVEWTVLNNELEALQLEYSWIKQFEPRFNVKYRDDKSYPWLCLTWNEEFPRVFVGRGSKKPNWRYFGPYSEAWAIRDAIDTLLTVFPIRTCTGGVFRTAKASGRPCLMGFIDKCSAPCVGKISAQQHRALAGDFCAAISGKASRFIKDLEIEMQACAQAMEYERAGVLRDKADALHRVMERNAVVLQDCTDVDLVALAMDELEVAVQVFYVRSGRILAERGWVAELAETNKASLVEAFLLQIYADVTGELQERKRAIPPEVLVPVLPSSVETLTELLSQTRGGKVKIRVPQRGDKKSLMATAEKNASGTLSLHQIRRASDLTVRNQALDEITQALGLPQVPLRIECYDISHIQGTNTVASMVVFEDGLARKSAYRHFAITTVESDDVGAISEVLTRRFIRLKADQAAMEDSHAGLIDATNRTARPFSYRPSLIVVDGGASQANTARQALDDLGFESVVVVGLAKRLEEVWIPGDEFPIILPRTSQALFLLQRIRDEAHRFAISYHRKKRSRAMTESLLDQVPGLGEVRRKALMRVFPSLKSLRGATVGEIGQVPGFGPNLAKAVVLAVLEKPEAINLTTGEVLD